MPNDDKLYQKFLDSMKKGLRKENGGNYGGQPNASSGAMGKYQFVPMYYWDKKPSGSLDSIPVFAKKNGFGDLKTKEDFINNPALQEAYFETYIKKEIYPKSKELYSKYGTTRNLRIDEIGSLLHFQGTGVGSQIVKSGKHKGETAINPSTKEDLRRFNNALKEQGSNGVSHSYSKSFTTDPKVARGEYNKYKTEIQTIEKNPEFSQQTKNLMIDNINKKYYQQGWFDSNDDGSNPRGWFNKIIEQENTDKESAFNVEKSKYSNVVNYFNSSLEQPYNSNTDKKNSFSFNNQNELDLSPRQGKNGAEVNNLKTLLKQNPEYAKYLYYEGHTEEFGSNKKPKRYNIKPEDLDLSPEELKKRFSSEKGWRSGQVKFIVPNSSSNKLLQDVNYGVKKLGDPNFNLFNANGKLNDNNFNINEIDKGSLMGFAHDKQYNFDYLLKQKINKDSYKIPSISKAPTWETSGDVLDDSNVGDVPGVGKQKVSLSKETYKKSNPGFTPEDYRDGSAAASKEVQEQGYVYEPMTAEPTPQKESLELFNDYFGMETEKPETGGYDPSQFKTEFPFADVVANIGLAISGTKMANTKLPMRDEQVNDDFRNYTAELAKLSAIGLRPEEEAHAKRMLSEAYQSGIEQTVKASGGNRNIVLGNLGRLDYNKQKGLLDISVADAQAKNTALFKYGEAIKYINEFDANRDITNNERKYNNAMMTKQTGAAMMAQGFQGILDNIQYYKENKPGSANHAYKSYMYREMFDVDPGLKDDGTGTIPYTMSWKKKQDEEKLALYYGNKETAKKAFSLSENNKKLAQKVMIETGGNTEIASGIVDYLYNNGDASNLDLTKINDAVKSKDYSMLFNNKSSIPSLATNPIFQSVAPSTKDANGNAGPINKSIEQPTNSGGIPDILKPVDNSSNLSPELAEANNAKDRFSKALANLNNYMGGESKDVDASSENALKTAEANNMKMINGNVGITQDKAQIDKNISDWFGTSELNRLKEEKQNIN